MRTEQTLLALLIEISIGLGIVVHEGFFVVAGAIAVRGLAVAFFTLLNDMPNTHDPPVTRNN